MVETEEQYAFIHEFCKDYLSNYKTMKTKLYKKEYYKKKLTGIQYNVAFEHGTERPWINEYNGNKKEGIYKSIVSGVPLFSSKDKFDSGTGWPSFTKPVEARMVKETTDTTFGMSRTEVSCMEDNIHLGHVFPDGPRDKGGKRYCINSASLKFVPKDEMTKDEVAMYL